MPKPPTVIEKIGDWKTAFEAVRAELTDHKVRALRDALSEPPPEGADLSAWANMVNANISLARIVSANDRASGVIAAMLTQSGVSRPVIETEDEA